MISKEAMPYFFVRLEDSADRQQKSPLERAWCGAWPVERCEQEASQARMASAVLSLLHTLLSRGVLVLRQSINRKRLRAFACDLKRYSRSLEK